LVGSTKRTICRTSAVGTSVVFMNARAKGIRLISQITHEHWSELLGIGDGRVKEGRKWCRLCAKYL
jgi:hypothetical protein